MATPALAQSPVHIKVKGDAAKCLHRPTGGFDLALCTATQTKAVFKKAGNSNIAFGTVCVAARADFLLDSALQAIACPAVPNERTNWQLAGDQLRLTKRPDLCISIILGGATGTRAVLKKCLAFGVTRWEVAQVPAG